MQPPNPPTPNLFLDSPCDRHDHKKTTGEAILHKYVRIYLKQHFSDMNVAKNKFGWRWNRGLISEWGVCIQFRRRPIPTLLGFSNCRAFSWLNI